MEDDVRQVVENTLNTQNREVAQRWLFRAFLFFLLWVPLPLGSNRAWSWGLMELLIVTFLAVWVAILIVKQQRGQMHDVFDRAITQYRSILLLLCLGTLYPLWQIIPFSEVLLKVLSPATLALRNTAEAAVLAGPISLDIYATWVAWLKGIAYLGAFWLTLVLTDTRQKLMHLTWVLLASGLIQVGVSLLTANSDPTHYVTGTFMNRNHLAGFLELVLPVAMGLLLGWQQQEADSQTWIERLQAGLGFIMGPKALVMGVTIAMFLTLFMSQSRGGNACLFLSIFLLAGLSWFRRYKLRHRIHHGETRGQSSSRTLSLLVLFLVLVFIGIWSGLGHLMGRYMTTSVHHESERMNVNIVSLKIIKDYPLFGSGSGTFALMYPHYQNEKLTDALYTHAHNDHLETIASRGIVGYGLLAMGVAVGWFFMVRAYLRCRDSFACGLIYASLVATLSLSVHGLIDFNFQIPANALYFMVLLALGLRGAILSDASEHERSR